MANANAGRRGRRWERLKANLRACHHPCWLCGQPIDYGAHHTDPNSFSVDHIKSRLDYPELREEPTNLAAAHLRCNTGRGTRDPAPTIGSASRRW